MAELYTLQAYIRIIAAYLPPERNTRNIPLRHFYFNSKIIHMKKLYVFVIAILLTNLSFGQLIGTYTIPGSTYATIAAAITDLNTQGVGAGGVTFNVAAGYTETISARLNLTATGTLANQIVFQKSGSGANPKITAYSGGTATPSSATPDGIWSFQGSDYIIIDGIDLYDPNAATRQLWNMAMVCLRTTLLMERKISPSRIVLLP